MTKLKVIAVTLASAGILTVGAGLLAQQSKGSGVGQRVGGPGEPATKDTVSVDPAIKPLIESCVATAREVFEQEIKRYEETLTAFPDDTAFWSRRWMEDQLRLGLKQAEGLAAIQAHLERVKHLEKIAEQYAKAGQGRTSDALKAKYFRLEAEQMLVVARSMYRDVR
jgi:hypothetical protein